MTKVHRLYTVQAAKHRYDFPAFIHFSFSWYTPSAVRRGYVTPVSDVGSYAIIRKFLDSIYNILVSIRTPVGNPNMHRTYGFMKLLTRRTVCTGS
jgi:hypothetical protein